MTTNILFLPKVILILKLIKEKMNNNSQYLIFVKPNTDLEWIKNKQIIAAKILFLPKLILILK